MVAKSGQSREGEEFYGHMLGSFHLMKGIKEETICFPPLDGASECDALSWRDCDSNQGELV